MPNPTTPYRPYQNPTTMCPTPGSSKVSSTTSPVLVLEEIARLASVYRKLRPRAAHARIVLHLDNEKECFPENSFALTKATRPGDTVHAIPATISMLMPDRGYGKGCIETSGGKFELGEMSTNESQNGLRGPACDDASCCEHGAWLNNDQTIGAGARVPDTWHNAFQTVDSRSSLVVEFKQKQREGKREPDLWHEAFQNLSMRPKVVTKRQVSTHKHVSDSQDQAL